MIIELTSIVERPVSVNETFSDIDLELDDASIVGDVSFAGEKVRIDGKAHIRGNVKGEVEIACTRCTTAVLRPFDIEFDDVFVNEPLKDGEEAVEEVDLDESYVENGEVDLSEVVREQILLDLPEQVYCSDGCKGLCPKCGSNLNLIDCNCNFNEIDPRWAALKGLN
ncbi:MAG TPA: DUF177 domain-containing protein [Pyrinomonadaceae bacterium]|nr:DUF177 domain-containing protein [Pyrinomonadaceae bacterium]